MPRAIKRSVRDRIVWALGMVAAVAILCAVYFAAQARREASTAEDVRRALSSANHELASAREQLASRTAHDAASALVLPDPALPPASVATPPPVTAPTLSAPPDMRSTFRSPAMRQMLRRGQLSNLRPIYDPLLTQLNVSPKDREHFYDLQLTVGDPAIGLDKLPSEAATAEERTQIEDQIRQSRDLALQQLRDLLGDKDYQLYDSYRATEGERTLVQQFRQQADPRSAPISDWQYDRLRDLLIQTRAQYPPVNNDFSASYAAAVAQAAQILTPDQLESFRNYLQNQQDVSNMIQKLVPPPGR